MAQVNENPGILLYSRIRKSPYFYASRRHGVEMYSVYNHTYHPRHYGDPVEEYWHLLNGVTLWDVGVERQIEISGPDAFEFTNLLVARDLEQVRGRAVQVRLPLPARRRDHQRPRAAARRGEPLLALARRQRRGAVGARRRLQLGPRRDDQGDRRRAGAGAGAEVEGRDGRSVRRQHPRDPLLLPAPVRARRNEGARLAHRLHGRARLRDLPVRGQQERGQALGRRARGGQAARARGDRSVPHPPHRGRHPRPRSRLRHVVRHESLRGRHGLRLDGRPRVGHRLHRQGGPARRSRPRAPSASWSASRSAASSSGRTTTAR